MTWLPLLRNGRAVLNRQRTRLTCSSGLRVSAVRRHPLRVLKVFYTIVGLGGMQSVRLNRYLGALT